MKITQKGDLVPLVAELISNFFALDTEDTVRKRALRYLNLHELKDFVEQLMDSLKPDLIESNVKEDFTEYGLTVQCVEGKSQGYIEVLKLYKELFKENRERDFFQVASVTKKALIDNLSDSENLISKFYVPSGASVSFIKVARLVEFASKPKKSKKTKD